ncbi:YbaB/EbfC family nucleoid-associated protein [Microbacterium sp. NPDC090007]|uniref:YbaB/EbfC family nucleoid-associated protein n=1 Tax=Microbacterium sp. NPDC090007 TaxID=3364204 RepID=UPI003808EB47
MSPDPDESFAQVEADVRRAESRAARMPAFEAAVAAARGTGRSRGRDIVVQVDSAGRVVDLRLSESALARGASRLAAELVTAIREAEADAHRATLQAVTGLLGADDPIVAQLRDAAAPTARERTARGR